MRTTSQLRTPAALAFLITAAAGASAQAPPTCPDGVPCNRVSSFIATLTDFRTSVQGRGDRVAAVTLTIRNIGPQVLRLGYVQNSGVATDDRGNRYGVASIRGIGEITGRGFDPKFVLQPGESATTRFEFFFRPTGGVIFGSVYDVELALREIDPITASQFQLGREHVLQYKTLTQEGVAAALAGAAAAPSAPVPAAAPAAPAAETPPAPADPCAGKARCYHGGPFIAEVLSVTPSMVGNRHHHLSINIRIRNLSAEPIWLAYKGGTSSAVDELGNRYYWGRAGTHDGSVQGIGVVTARSADARFGLKPGESRNAVFGVIRFEAARRQIGTKWSFDAALVELIPLNQTQANQGREFAMGFQDLTAGSGNAVRGLLNDLQKAIKKP